MITLASDCIVRVLIVETKETIIFEGHSRGVSDISWGCDSSFVVSASDDMTLIVWDVAKVSLFVHYA